MQLWALGLANLHFTGEPTAAACNAALARAQGRVNHAAPAAALALPTHPPSAGWFAVDAHAVQVGRGDEDFRTAAAAVSTWAHANALPWVAVTAPKSSRRPPNPGDPVVIAVRATGPVNFGRWLSPWLANPLVVVGVREGRGKARWQTAGGPAAAVALPATAAAAVVAAAGGTLSRYDLALATTASHVLAGGERFSIIHRAADDSVWFEAAAFARPATMVAALGWPVVRGLQAAFRRGAGAAVQEALRVGGGGKERRRRFGLW